MNHTGPRLFTIIVHYGSGASTQRTLDSVVSQAPSDWDHHIVVVDNASPTRLPSRLRTGIHLITATTNNGFAAGCNLGIRYALTHGAQHILLLNNDVTLAPDLLLRLREGITRYPRAGAFGGKVLYADTPHLIWFAGGLICPWLTHTLHLGLNTPDASWPDREHAVDYVTGTLMLIPAHVIRTVGVLDEDYFLYFEDADFCHRVRSQNLAIMYLPHARCWHDVGGGRPHCLEPRYLYYSTRNRFRMFSRRRRWWTATYVVLVCTLLFGMARAAVILAGLSGPRRPLLRALVYGWWDGIRGRTGRGPLPFH